MKRLQQPRFFITNDDRTLVVKFIESPPEGADPSEWITAPEVSVEIPLRKNADRTPRPGGSS